MQHILYTPKTSVRTVRPSPRNCPLPNVIDGVTGSNNSVNPTMRIYLIVSQKIQLRMAYVETWSMI